MSMITLTFEDYDEMLGFARKLLNVEKETTDLPVEKAAQAEALKQQPAATVPYGQQIAPHFPEANTGAAATVQAPQAPVPSMTPPAQPAAPVMTPPMQPATQPAPAPQTPPAQPAAVPTTEHTYTAEELQTAAVLMVDKDPGMMAHIQELLQQFGVSALPELPAEKYGAFATALRGMGAQI